MLYAFLLYNDGYFMFLNKKNKCLSKFYLFDKHIER
ncbi:hypothetical protein PEPS_09780 [Persicobacter psychrovividus]|uniref:Uncharacterized protein n=1 Tax=Persicobacter psychrovividus TaxID=387638 RepID=A0ABN6L6A5_9BACT|nr:hypothetical protein PEPS_09780 [Persicobacter psychrovividus]